MRIRLFRKNAQRSLCRDCQRVDISNTTSMVVGTPEGIGRRPCAEVGIVYRSSGQQATTNIRSDSGITKSCRELRTRMGWQPRSQRLRKIEQTSQSGSSGQDLTRPTVNEVYETPTAMSMKEVVAAAESDEFDFGKLYAVLLVLS